MASYHGGRSTVYDGTITMVRHYHGNLSVVNYDTDMIQLWQAARSDSDSHPIMRILANRQWPDNLNQPSEHLRLTRSATFSDNRKSTLSTDAIAEFRPCRRRPSTNGTLWYGPIAIFGQNSTGQLPDISSPHPFLWENFSAVNSHGDQPTWQSKIRINRGPTG